MDNRGVNKYDLNTNCAVLAQEYPFARRLNSMARQAAAERAWFAISRFYENCKNKKPGKKGYPQFQHNNRSVEYKTSGWKLDPDGRHIIFTDGCGIARLKLVGNPNQRIQAFPIKLIKRVRIVRLKNMVRNRKLAKSIHDAGWGIFLQWLACYGFLHEIPI